jgi:hypothetical protein
MVSHFLEEKMEKFIRELLEAKVSSLERVLALLIFVNNITKEVKLYVAQQQQIELVMLCFIPYTANRSNITALSLSNTLP